MQHHLLATQVALWVSMFASAIGAAFAMFAALWSAKHPGPRAFDFAASARRIRTRPIRARYDA
jgi:hypothetical protein